MATIISSIWACLSSNVPFLSFLILLIANLITVIIWIWEHYFRNYRNRYELKPRHIRWIEGMKDRISLEFTKRGKFGDDQQFVNYKGGAIFCFCLINKGTSDDYIYSAKIINEQGKEKDVSTECIIKGVEISGQNDYEYFYENLPHGIKALQGEVWFVGVEDNEFVNCKKGTLEIETAAKKYPLQITEEMFVKSMGTLPYNKDVKIQHGNRDV